MSGRCGARATTSSVGRQRWRAAYAHAGGSPQALTTLRLQGRGQLVYNVDQFAYSDYNFWRILRKNAPHNLYTSGIRLRQMANALGARSSEAPPAPVWTFGAARALEDRPTGGSLEAFYFANHIRYTYDRATNTYPRWVSPGVKQVDASTGKRVAPTNVVIMFVRFGALDDGHPDKLRLDADFIGSGKAYLATNGRTVPARWVKRSIAAPTRFCRCRRPLDRAGARPDVHPGDADGIACRDLGREGAGASATGGPHVAAAVGRGAGAGALPAQPRRDATRA